LAPRRLLSINSLVSEYVGMFGRDGHTVIKRNYLTFSPHNELHSVVSEPSIHGSRPLRPRIHVLRQLSPFITFNDIDDMSAEASCFAAD